MFLFGNKDGAKGNISSKTFAWDDIHKGENVIYRYPRNIQWNDNVVVREDECAIFRTLIHGTPVETDQARLSLYRENPSDPSAAEISRERVLAAEKNFLAQRGPGSPCYRCYMNLRMIINQEERSGFLI